MERRFDRDNRSSHFAIKPERMEAILEDASILINEKTIFSIKDLLQSSSRSRRWASPTRCGRA